MDVSSNSHFEQLYECIDVANWLHVDVKTVRRYVAAGMFKNLLIIKREKRNRTLFTQASIDEFIATHMAGLPSPERPKRAYNRRQIKGKHKKRGK